MLPCDISYKWDLVFWIAATVKHLTLYTWALLKAVVLLPVYGLPSAQSSWVPAKLMAMVPPSALDGLEPRYHYWSSCMWTTQTSSTDLTKEPSLLGPTSYYILGKSTPSNWRKLKTIKIYCRHCIPLLKTGP